ncbi:MAG: proline dehydrogenase family protein [Flavobacteriales bacterium]|nr:proline dehydrogenase family protein [Flavobacteriales bacterium]
MGIDKHDITAPEADLKKDGKTAEVSFENTATAFSGKNDTDLRRAYVLFRIIGNHTLSMIGKYASKIAFALRLPIKGAIKATIFKQFVGGETVEECATTIKDLAAFNIGTILDYSVEGRADEDELDLNMAKILETAELSASNSAIPYCVFKVSGLAKNRILEKVSRGIELTEKEARMHKNAVNRVETICRKASDAGTAVFIDAEESWIQPAIDELATQMMKKYNGKRAIVHNTLQMYRHDRLAHLIEAYEKAKAEDYYYGVKIVRGAYMDKERERAEENDYPSPIQPDKASTDRDFNAAILFCIEHIDGIEFCAGTHNEESCMLMAAELVRHGIDPNDRRAYSAQLLGMSDHISFNLSAAGFNVAKYVPFGPVKEVMPYLIRRADENTSVSGQMGRELGLIVREMKRRRKEA